MDILSLTGQSLGYSQILDEAAQFQAFSENSVLRVKIQNTLLHKSKRGSLENS